MSNFSSGKADIEMIEAIDFMVERVSNIIITYYLIVTNFYFLA